MNKDLISAKFDSLDQYHLGRLDRETEEWTRLGVYDKAADMLDLKKGEIHVDLGSGNGEFLSRLSQVFPQSILIGVERSKLLLALSASRLCSSGIHTWQLYSESIKANGEGTAEKSFSVDDERLKEKSFLHEGFVTLVQDDIRRLSVLKKLLGKRKIDSATFMFPGVSESMAFETPYSLEGMDYFTGILKAYGSLKASDFCDPADLEKAKTNVESSKREIDRRVSEIMIATRKSVYQILSELVRANGNIVVTERTDPALMAGEDQIQKIRDSFMGECGRYWLPERPDILIGVTKRKFGSSCIDFLHGQDAPSENEQNDVIIQRFRKIQRAFIKPTIKQLLNMLIK